MAAAICYLTDAGFGRWPMFGPVFARSATLGFAVTSLVVDSLVLCGIARDWIVDRKVGVVYRYLGTVVIRDACAKNSHQ